MLRLILLFLAAAPVMALEPVKMSASNPRNAEMTAALRIERLDAEVTLRGVLAETQATLTLAVDADPKERMEGRLVFALPPHCTITGAALDIGDIMRPASVTFKETARQAYDSVVSRMLDPCLVQLLPDGRVSVQVFPFTGGKPRKVRLEFSHLLPPGQAWEFPLRFASPVAAHLKTDAPFEKRDASFGGFLGGEEWRLNVAESDRGQLLAHPDGRGGFVFQKLLPAVAPSGPPRHLLVLVDVSLLQATRDAAAERALLERLFQSIGEGRATLTTFSTALHSREEFAVQGGKCEALLAEVAALQYDGAPRPGAVDVATVPADLTLVLSTLAAPMAGGRVPALPAAAPVWVADSLSPAPSAVAARIAEDAGGNAFDPRQPVELVFHPRPVLESKNLTGITTRAIPGAPWRLATGRLDGATGILTAGGLSRSITRGDDAAAGRLAVNFIRREEFRRRGNERHAGTAGDSLRDKDSSPFLNEWTAFIVLEEAWQYEQFGIPLPPDLTKAAPRSSSNLEESDQNEYEAFLDALRRPAGTSADPQIWHWRLRSGMKRAFLEAEWHSQRKFHEHRQPVAARQDFPEWLLEDKEWQTLWDKAERGASLSRQLAVRFASAPDGADGADAELIRQAREQQVNRVKLMEWVGDFSGELRSGGGPGLDPLSFRDFATRGGADPFAGGGSGSGSGFGAASDAGNEPFGPPPAPAVVVSPPTAPDTVAAPAAPPSSGAPQVPQTFGGAPLALLDAVAAGAARNGHDKRARELVVAKLRQEVLARAKALHRAGQQPEAIRALSVLAIPGQDDHALLRLLAWLLQEWGEHALALEVLAQAERKFGDSETTLRDLGTAALAAGRKDEAQRHLDRARHHVGRRDAALLDGRMSAPALRVVVECADETADADLEISGPDYELCDWRNPLPAFGGALSFDGAGMAPEDFVLPVLPAAPLQVRVRLKTERPVPLRVTITENPPGGSTRSRVYLYPAAAAGRISVAEITP